VIRSSPMTGIRIGSPVADDPSAEETVRALTVDQLGKLITEVPGWQRLLVSRSWVSG